MSHLPPPIYVAGSAETLFVDQAAFQQLSARLEAAEAEIVALRQGDVPPDAPGDLPAISPVPDSACDGCFNCKPAGDGPPKLPFLTPLSMGEGRCYCGPGGDITFKPGVRLQPRYIYDNGNNNHDFFIRRFRLKSSGDVFGIAKYGTELKIDSTSRIGSDPKAVVENAWLDFLLCPEVAYLRVGLYDLPFSRNALTSDSKLLFMDRTLIKGALTSEGLADNTVGLLFHGRPFAGRFEYSVGIFDNFTYEQFGSTGTQDSDHLMPTGRIGLNLLDPVTAADGYADYRESYIGEGQRLQIGFNAAYLEDAVDGVDEFDLYGWGVDLFFNSGPFVFQAEYDLFEEDMASGTTPDVEGDGWYVQAGCLLCCVCETAVEIAGRYQELDADSTVHDDQLRWTSVGMNFYIRDHNLKVQADYTFKREEGTELDNDLFQVQLQMDY